MHKRPFFLYSWRLGMVLIGLAFGLEVGLSQSLPVGFPETPRQKLALLTDWAYYLDDTTGGFFQAPPRNVSWERVSIPHTLELTSSTLNDSKDDEYQLSFHRAIGWYKRDVVLEEGDGEKVFLEFEGAHQVTKLWVNGTLVGEHAVGGYTPFHFDITDYVRFGKKPNEIILSVDNRRNPNIPPEGDRYDYIKWSGLYRDVYLVKTAPIHITFPWENTFAGVTITTPTVEKEDVTISVRTQVRNESSETVECQIINRVIDAQGRVVLTLESSSLVGPHSDALVAQTGGIVENVQLWSPDYPYLYRVNTTVWVNGEAVDVQENPLGIRKVELIEGRGLVLNGQDLELVGVNRHQAMLFLGDAVPNSVHWKDAWQMKQMGINSVRLAHYPHDNSFIEACDQLGILVYEEPPTWIGIGGPIWMANLEEATRRMVRNHRNHPSVIMWGAAINHRGPVERLHYACKEEDPSRFTGSNGAPWTGPQQSWITEVYSPMDYANMPISDGEFTYLCEHGASPDGLRNQDFLSRSKGMTNMIGVAAWTAHEYQTFKPKSLLNINRPFSVDRVPYPSFYWFQAELLDRPVVHIANQLVSKDGQVVVFGNCHRVELYHNDQFVESRIPQVRPEAPYIDHPNISFPFNWTAGKLTVKGYVGQEMVATHTRYFPAEPYRLDLTIEEDNQPFYANGSDIKLAQCYLLDKQGERVLAAENKITFEVEGAATLVESPTIDANPRKPTFGVATAYIRAGEQAGTIVLTAKSEGLLIGRDTIQTIPYVTNRTIAEAQPIYDLKQELIDFSPGMTQVEQEGVGAFEFGKHDANSITSQYLQFGWNAWNGQDPHRASYTSSVFGCSYTLESSHPIEWYSGWGQTGNLPYLAIDGVSTPGKSDLILTLSGLAEGVYTFTSYHHRRQNMNRTPKDFMITWQDATSSAHQLSSTFAPSSGPLYTAYPASQQILLHSNGKDPIVITFQNEGELELVLNGFILKETLEMYSRE